ncbi:MAG: PLP-dependent aminotransferase family protein [Pseudomonas sp.]|uniref:MocR-like pyridoxine biosynthesis transcription factor PdxR n=1 Tax=Pseudomonas sp. TaxID=306 RepID=UPI003392306A
MAADNSPLVVLLPLAPPAPGVGLQRWLYEAVREAILSGRLPAGSQLPSTRAMAGHYQIARGTVQAAYQQLGSEGYLLTRVGSGTRVSEVVPDARLHTGYVRRQVAPPELPQALPDTPWMQRVAGLTPIFAKRDRTPGLYPFFPHRGDVRAFPVDLWRQLHNQHLRHSRLPALMDADPAGLPALREAIAGHLAISRGVRVAAEHILVLSSVQQALDLSLRLLVPVDGQVWIEDPGYPGARQLMALMGVSQVPVPVDEQGIQVEVGIAMAPRARLAYVTPSRQAPLGAELSPARRLALLRWASAEDAYIFEDDYDSEYRFIAKPIPALRSLPGGERRVILAGTFSKLLFPSIRLAYMVLPAPLVEPFTRAAALLARHANSLAQAVLADFIVQGHLDRHVRRMRKLYGQRADAFAEAAHGHWRGLIEVPEIRAGLDVVGELQGIDEQLAWTRLNEAGIDVLPLGRYCYCTRPRPPGLVMGFAPYDCAAIDAAARRLAQTLRG